MGANQPVTDQDVLRLLKQAAAEEGARAWIVGGYVRDKLLGRPHPDPDVVVEQGSAPMLAQRFARLAGAPPPVTFERFGTAQVTAAGSHRRVRIGARRVLSAGLAQARRPAGLARG